MKEEQLPTLSNINQESLNIDSLQLEENTNDPSFLNNLGQGLKGVSDTGDVIFYYPEGISIQKNTSTLEVPSVAIDFKYKINTYLLEHPEKEVHIISLYDASENMEAPNFGIQRGRKIEQILEEMGVPSEKILVKPMIKDLSFSNTGTFENGISFYFSKLDTVRIKAAKFSLPEPKTIYPKFVNNDIFVNEPLRNLLQETRHILSQHPNATLEIIGHTDNIGNANDNYLLGLQFARQVRWYLINKGQIDKDRVEASSAGESQSIATNATENGRNINRRIEIKYKAR